jgi:hypothetical protein
MAHPAGVAIVSHAGIRAICAPDIRKPARASFGNISVSDCVGTSGRRARSFLCAPRWLNLSCGLIVIVLIIWARRGTLVSAARVTILRWSILRLRRKKHVIAGAAEPRSVAPQASRDALCVRDIGPAEPKHIRCTGLTLLIRPLRARRCLGEQKKSERCEAAGYLMRPHNCSLENDESWSRQSLINEPCRIPGWMTARRMG